MDALDAIEKNDQVPVGHRLAKILLATAAGFIASELVKNAYSKFVIERNNDTSEDH